MLVVKNKSIYLLWELNEKKLYRTDRLHSRLVTWLQTKNFDFVIAMWFGKFLNLFIYLFITIIIIIIIIIIIVFLCWVLCSCSLVCVLVFVFVCLFFRGVLLLCLFQFSFLSVR